MAKEDNARCYNGTGGVVERFREG